jgi:predicted AAA+ superfamily ATPase
MEPKDDDPTFQSFFNDIKALYQKGETVTTTVDPKTGKKIQKRTGGVTDAMVQAKIDKYYNENNQDFLEAKSLEATDYFSQWMRS